MLPAFQQGFVDIALVQLRIAGDRDMAARRHTFRQQAVQAHVILDQRGEAGGRDAEAHRSGGEIDLAAIFHPAGIGLGTAEPAQVLHLVARLPPEQGLRGMKYRGGVGLYGDAIPWPELFEIQRREDGDHRSAARLVPAHLQPIPVGPHMVGVVHHPGGEPQQLALDLFEREQAWG